MLAQRLRERIHREGPITFAAFMEAALYDDRDGFFTRGAGAGRAGADFVTSPEVGPLFGRLVARALDRSWAAMGEPDPFDSVVMAGNVMAFVAPDSEVDVLRNLAAHLAPHGFIAAGFHVDRLALHEFDRHVEESGLAIDHRFATWDLERWHDDADFAVTVLRHPGGD